jgi:initiation factor 1A
MPNQKGGKGYKKGKHTTDEKFDIQMISWNSADGQMLGRVVKTLGQKRFRVYCNDNVERTCRLAGSVRKSQWVAEGSVVVVSLRFLGSGSAGGAGEEGGDILQVVDPRLYGKLKKMEGVSENIFVQIEQMDKEAVKRRVAEGGKAADDDDFFDRDDETAKPASASSSADSDVDIDEI